MQTPRLMRVIFRAMGLLATVVAVVGIVEQVRRPPDERTWHGSVLGVPYDFRPPSFERLRAAWWNPDTERLFTARDFGVGWAINFAQVAKIVRELRQQANQMNA